MILPKYVLYAGVLMRMILLLNMLKTCFFRLPAVSKKQAILMLHKQRYLCKCCNHTSSAKTKIVDEHCSISSNNPSWFLLDAKNKISEKDNAKGNFVSHATVNSMIHKPDSEFKIIKNFLPPLLSFNEFNSVKSVSNHMSFIFINAENGNILNIVENRRLNHLLRYFMSYSSKARKSVETVCMDMYSPYISLVKPGSQTPK